MNQSAKLFLLILFFKSILSFSQDSFKDNLIVNSKYYYGYVLPEYSSFIYVIDEPVNSFSLSVSKQTFGKNSWQQLYNYPELGVAFFYTSLGNSKVNGYEYALYPFTVLHLYSGKKVSLNNTIGIGLSYATKKFEMKNNYSNITIGSHLNIHFNFKLGVQYFITKKVGIETGLSFDHLSNGNLQEPNIGINNFTAFAGVSYMLGNYIEPVKNEMEQHKKSWEFEAIYSIGGKKARALASEFFLTSSASVNANWKLFRGFYIGTGADLFYDSAAEKEIEAKKGNYKSSYDYSAGIHFSQHVVYNRLSVILQEGFYVIPNHTVNKVMYNRGIVKFQVAKHFSVRVAMKSHLHILDFPEFGIGFNW